jgi:hypothetical protein
MGSQKLPRRTSAKSLGSGHDTRVAHEQRDWASRTLYRLSWGPDCSVPVGVELHDLREDAAYRSFEPSPLGT